MSNNRKLGGFPPPKSAIHEEARILLAKYASSHIILGGGGIYVVWTHIIEQHYKNGARSSAVG